MTTKTDEQERADFEAWLLTLGLHLGNHERQLMLLAYQAGRAALLAERDALREALWVATEHNALHFGESHNTVIQGRAALAQGEA